MVIHLCESLEWQTPVVTEKYSYELLKNDKDFDSLSVCYSATPWATLVDNFQLKNKKCGTLSMSEYYFKSCKLSSLKPNHCFTVCQTFKFKNLLEVFLESGIHDLFLPHAVQSEAQAIKDTYGINIYPYPLYPVNSVIPSLKKNIYYSFIGNINYVDSDNNYGKTSSELRKKVIERINHPSNTHVLAIDYWHFDELVYKYGIHQKKLNPIDIYSISKRELEYKRVLAKSRFALCPRGMGPASIRFWEALGSGAIPVNISDDFWLPGEEYFDWDSCVVTVKEKDILDIPDILNEISKEQEQEMRKNALKAFKMFTGENFISPIKYKLLGVVPDVD